MRAGGAVGIGGEHSCYFTVDAFRKQCHCLGVKGGDQALYRDALQIVGNSQTDLDVIGAERKAGESSVKNIIRAFEEGD